MDTEKLLLALDHLSTGLRLLDESDAPAQIGAYVDLAIHQLQETVRIGSGQVAHQAIETNAEPQ